jgi:hypothetical protein
VLIELFSLKIMADQVKCVISKYQQRLMEMPFVPPSSFGRATLGDDGDANKLFLTMAVIDAWIEPGTTVISDCWGAYRNLDTHGYTHHTVNHSIEFVERRTGAHTNTTESTWRHMKAHLNQYSRKVDYIYDLAH